MSKEWAGKVFLGLIIYFVILTLTLSYGQAMAESFGSTLNGNTTNSVNLSTAFGTQSSCDYPRYRYNQNGDSSRYIFNLDNLDCEISVGAISPNNCNALNGCNWANETTGWLWFSSTNQYCNGTLNKTYYNDNVPTTENICEINGLQGDTNVNTCSVLGCTVYAPRNDASGVKSPVGLLDTVGDLFLFRYDFGFETGLYTFLANFLIFTLPLIVLLLCIYLLSPFSN